MLDVEVFDDPGPAAVVRLVARHHDPAVPEGRPHRLVAAAHALPAEPDPATEEVT